MDAGFAGFSIVAAALQNRHADCEQLAECIAPLTDDLREMLLGLGDNVAVDSTTFRSYSNHSRKLVGDPHASWTAKNKARAWGGKEWFWGYKLHLVVDAVHKVPLVGYVTTANRNDSPDCRSCSTTSRRRTSGSILSSSWQTRAMIRGSITKRS